MNESNYKLHYLNNHGSKEERKKEFKYYCDECDFGCFAEICFVRHNDTRNHKYYFNNIYMSYDICLNITKINATNVRIYSENPPIVPLILSYPASLFFFLSSKRCIKRSSSSFLRISMKDPKSSTAFSR